MLLDRLKEYWLDLSRTARAMLSTLLLLALGGLCAFVLAPAYKVQVKLSADLPKLRAQRADMLQEEKLIASIRKKEREGGKRADIKTLLKIAIARSSFVNAIERLETVSSDEVQFVAAPVIFDDWIVWISDLQREFGIRVQSCKVTALDQPGFVRIEVTLVAAKRSLVEQ